MSNSNDVSFINAGAFPKVIDFEKFSKMIDPRLQPYMKGWQLKEIYFGKTVKIPGHTNSKFEPIRYFEVIKDKGEAFSEHGQRDNEKCLTLFAHWPGYDHECEVNLFIRGRDVLDESSNKVSAEIIRAGGAPMEVWWERKLLTDFTQREWFFVKSVDKVWIDDIRSVPER